MLLPPSCFGNLAHAQTNCTYFNPTITLKQFEIAVAEQKHAMMMLFQGVTDEYFV